MHLLAVSGSLRPSSSNTALLKAAAAMAPQGVTFDFYEGLDWTVSMGVLDGKPVAAWAASPMGDGPFGSGGSRTHQGLVWVLTALGTRFVEEAALVLPLIRTKLDGAGNVTDPDPAKALDDSLQALLRVVGEDR